MENDDEAILPLLMDFYERKIREKYDRDVGISDIEVVAFGVLVLAWLTDKQQATLYRIERMLKKAVEA